VTPESTDSSTLGMPSTFPWLIVWTACRLLLHPHNPGLEPTEPSPEIFIETTRGCTACVDAGEGRVRLQIGQEGAKATARSRDGRWLARLIWSGTVVLHDLRDGAERERLETLPFVPPPQLDWDGPPQWESWWGEDRCVRFAASDEHLVLAKGHRATELWSIEPCERIALLVLEDEIEATALDVSADGAWIATGDKDGRIAIWSAANGELAKAPTKISGAITSVHFDPSGMRLAIGTNGCYVHVLELEGGALRELLPSRRTGPDFGLGIEDVRFDPKGSLLVALSGSFGPRVCAWNTASWTIAWETDVAWGRNTHGSIRFGRDGARLLLSGRGLALDARDGSILCEVFPIRADMHLATNGEQAWSLEGDLLRIYSFEPCVRIRDVHL
jgi:WD40 repeat protein